MYPNSNDPNHKLLIKIIGNTLQHLNNTLNPGVGSLRTPITTFQENIASFWVNITSLKKILLLKVGIFTLLK